ncbi:MAG: hypothetical protein ACXAB4_07890, partial [Candidatus Hodarchaeales archaeon]
PSDVTYTEGQTGNRIRWQPIDDDPDSYQIFQNGTLAASGGWEGSAVEYNIDGLAPGTHNFTIVVHDEAGNTAADSVLVVVKPASENGGSKTTPGWQALGCLLSLWSVALWIIRKRRIFREQQCSLIRD